MALTASAVMLYWVNTKNPDARLYSRETYAVDESVGYLIRQVHASLQTQIDAQSPRSKLSQAGQAGHISKQCLPMRRFSAAIRQRPDPFPSSVADSPRAPLSKLQLCLH
jgi:hypothetical protein